MRCFWNILCFQRCGVVFVDGICIKDYGFLFSCESLETDACCDYPFGGGGCMHLGFNADEIMEFRYETKSQ